MALDSLTADQRAILDLEARWFATSGGKEAATKELGHRPIRYYQLVSQLVGTELAVAYDPVTVNRLRRVTTRDTIRE